MATTKWSTSGIEIHMNDQPILLKGMCYAPTTKGYSDGVPQVGDWFYDKCGCIWSSENNGDRADLAQMKDMGINHIRTYFWWRWQWPTDKDGTEWILQGGWKANGAPIFDHTRFLDECQKNGIYVMMGLAIDKGNVYTKSPNQQHFIDFYTDTAREIGKAYGNHPAVMGLVVGNETNDPSLCADINYWNITSGIANAFKSVAPDKLTMIAFQNDINLLTYTAGGKSVPEILKETIDVVGLNIYGDPTYTLSVYNDRQVAANNGANAMPLIVSEWGVGGGKNVENPKYNDVTFNFPKTRVEPGGNTVPISPLEGPPYGIALAKEFNEEDFNTANENMVKYINAMKKWPFVVGTEYFEWTDEYWKNKTDPSILSAIDSGALQLDQWGRYEFPYPMPPNYTGTVEYRIPTQVDEQDASASPDWPEECWGLFGIETNPNGPVGWTELGYMYNPDQLLERPTVGALKALLAGWTVQNE